MQSAVVIYTLLCAHIVLSIVGTEVTWEYMEHTYSTYEL